MISGGRGYLSQSELPVTFGLGRRGGFESITITWPGRGTHETKLAAKDVQLDKTNYVNEDGKVTLGPHGGPIVHGNDADGGAPIDGGGPRRRHK